MNYNPQVIEKRERFKKAGSRINAMLEENRRKVEKQQAEREAKVKAAAKRKARIQKTFAWIKNENAKIEAKRPKSTKELLIMKLDARNEQLRRKRNPVLDLEISLATSTGEEGIIDTMQVKTEQSFADVGDEVKINNKVPEDGTYISAEGDSYEIESGYIIGITEADPVDESTLSTESLKKQIKLRLKGIPAHKPKARHRSTDPVKDKLFAKLDARNRQLRERRSR